MNEPPIMSMLRALETHDRSGGGRGSGCSRLIGWENRIGLWW